MPSEGNPWSYLGISLVDNLNGNTFGCTDLEAENYAYMTGQCLKMQSNILLGLEGGYDLQALEECSVSVVNEIVE